MNYKLLGERFSHKLPIAESRYRERIIVNVAFIGMGTMGAPMALNLLNAGHDVTVYNRTRDREAPVAAAGARRAASPQDAAENAEIIITCVSDSPDVEAVMLGENGVIHGAKKGAIAIDMSSEMHSASLCLARPLHWGSDGSLRLLGGYRFFCYREGLAIGEALVSTDTTETLIPLGTTLDVFDQFDLENDFHGGEIGLATQHQWGPLWIEGTAKAAIGCVCKSARIDGGAVVVTPPPDSTTSYGSGGLLAMPSNRGVYRANDLAVLPELGVNARLDLTDRVSLTCGYTLLWLDNVWRVGEQIDRGVDPRQITNLEQIGDTDSANRPAPLFNDSGFWAQGLHVGLIVWLP
jgi:hypothetical protein